jgi:hypothetical protein
MFCGDVFYFLSATPRRSSTPRQRNLMPATMVQLFRSSKVGVDLFYLDRMESAACSSRLGLIPIQT